ncbi:MAG TPA: hypothetical protein DIC53_03260, partial [Synergistaceae bacterium]|nr:hypothetical protein [Synergistaceae bacterium]
MRQIVLVLSMATVVLFGYALAGLGGYLMDRGRPDYILFGLAGGFACAAAALILWKKYLVDLEEELNEKESEPSGAKDSEDVRQG